MYKKILGKETYKPWIININSNKFLNKKWNGGSMKLLPINKCLDCYNRQLVIHAGSGYKFVCGHPEGGFDIDKPNDGIPTVCPLEDLIGLSSLRL